MSAKIGQFIGEIKEAFQKGTFIKCTLSKPTSEAEEQLKNIYLKPVMLKKGLHVAFNFRYKTRDEVKNFEWQVAENLLNNLLGRAFLHADLFTSTEDCALQTNSKGEAILLYKKPSQTRSSELQHDRQKQRLLDPHSPWLHTLGITNARGEVLASAQDKWRQINKYLEVIQSLLTGVQLSDSPQIADMGSGKGYLTFALYDFLKNNLGLNPNITGIELRPNLVDFCNKAAQSAQFDGLHFAAMDIKNYQPEHLDMLIALHACDTATDLALATGIHQKAKVVVAAPCCHKQIRREMAASNEMAALMRHGILEERQAEIITDGIRALLLEANGYQTKVFEFVSTEHTAKNVMITALKSEDARQAQLQSKRQKALEQVAALK
jgi:hypothetical protein